MYEKIKGLSHSGPRVCRDKVRELVKRVGLWGKRNLKESKR